VPYLRDIPLLGSLFRRQTKGKERSEVVILLKPTIVRGERLEEITQRDIDLIREMRQQLSGEAL
jgi:MSHA biogenesis protein MshL